MPQERLSPEENESSSSQIFPVIFPGGCGRIIPNQGFQGEVRRCGDSLEERMPGYFIACIECYIQ